MGFHLMRSDKPVIAFIALGANLGDRHKTIDASVDALRETSGIESIRVSDLIENPAVGMGDDAPAFLNGVAEVRTTLGPHALLRRLLEIEILLGRDRREKWEPRPIDLDLVLFGDQIISTDDLIIPHPLMHERKFVLEPLAQLAPEFVHPMLNMTIRGLLDALQRPMT